MITRLTASALSLSLLASTLPVAFAEETTNTTDQITTIDIVAPDELPCTDKNGKDHARCITDALKKWKNLEHEYSQAERKVVNAWKAAHANMGIGADYQKALRAMLADVKAQRDDFKKTLQAYRKAFFNEQETKRSQGDGRKATEVKLEKATLEAAKAKCGIEDDDGVYRLCMRQLLRGVPANVGKRSRSSNALLNK